MNLVATQPLFSIYHHPHHDLVFCAKVEIIELDSEVHLCEHLNMCGNMTFTDN